MYGREWPCIYEVKWVAKRVSLKGVGRNECDKHGGWKGDEIEWLGQLACDGSGNGGIGYEIADEIQVAKERHAVNFSMGSTSVKFSNLEIETVVLYPAVITKGCHVD